MFFDPNIPAEFNEDVVVLSHEAGHVVSWLSMGEKIVSLELTPTAHGLKGRTRYSYHVALAAETEPNARFFAERLLAGEAAGRKVCSGIAKNKICSFGVDADNIQDAAEVLRKLIDYQRRNYASEDENMDVTQVVGLARQHAGDQWRDWVAARLNATRGRLDANWSAIEALVIWLKPQIPLIVGVPKQFEGEKIMDFLRTTAVRPTAPSIVG